MTVMSRMANDASKASCRSRELGRNDTSSMRTTEPPPRTSTTDSTATVTIDLRYHNEQQESHVLYSPKSLWLPWTWTKAERTGSSGSSSGHPHHALITFIRCDLQFRSTGSIRRCVRPVPDRPIQWTPPTWASPQEARIAAP
ncbi:unnamed protein product [Cercospora beticola]|nr:unnamed protein product [Cercospora beticola]